MICFNQQLDITIKGPAFVQKTALANSCWQWQQVRPVPTMAVGVGTLIIIQVIKVTTPNLRGGTLQEGISMSWPLRCLMRWRLLNRNRGAHSSQGTCMRCSSLTHKHEQQMQVPCSLARANLEGCYFPTKTCWLDAAYGGLQTPMRP